MLPGTPLSYKADWLLRRADPKKGVEEGQRGGGAENRGRGRGRIFRRSVAFLKRYIP